MKKAQIAMEFLMTYGWAILVVLVAIGALGYFGVLAPNTLIKEISTPDITQSLEENECDYYAPVEDYGAVVDCYSDVFYNRMQHADIDGMICFYHDYNFLIRCHT